jgi:hypothetical protein
MSRFPAVTAFALIKALGRLGLRSSAPRAAIIFSGIRTGDVRSFLSTVAKL